MSSLGSKRIGVIAGDSYHELAFWYAVLRFREAGAAVTVIGSDADKTYRSRLGYPVLPDTGFTAATNEKFDAIVLTEGAPPKSSSDTEAIAFLTSAARAGAILAALGTGEQALASAGFLKARRVSATPETQRELQASGAECLSEAVVVDGTIITAGSINDIPSFFRALLTALDPSDSKSAPSATRR